MNNMSLINLINDPTLLFDGERLKKKIEDVKKDKAALTNVAGEYGVKYKREIQEGTEKKKLLLTDGEKRGLTEEETMKSYGCFIPTVRTPILNFLYFMISEGNDIDFEEERKKYNKLYGSLEDDFEYDKSGNIEPVKEMDEFLYGNMSHDVYKKIKKLKRLSQDMSNEHEAFLAYKLCMEMCKYYGLEFDKVKT